MTGRRYEIKLTCEAWLLAQVRAWVRVASEGFSQAYPPRQVNSLYFDTREIASMLDNLNGVSMRRKLRFRWYGTGYDAVRGHLELKCKNSQLGWKEQCHIPVAFDLTQTSWREILPQLAEHADHRFSTWLRVIDQPALINSYHREYFESADGELRITLDSGLRAWEQLMWARPNLALPAPLEDIVVIELKASPDCHRKLSNLLCRLPVQVSRNSKYVTGLASALCFL